MAQLDYPTSGAGEEGVEEAGFFTRWMWVYFSPRKAFTAVSRRPRWVVPFVLLIVLSAAMAHVTAPINREHMAQRIENSDSIPEEQKDQVLERMAGGGSTISQLVRIGGSAVVIAVMLSALGGIFLLINNMIFGGSARYAQTLGAAVYTCLIWIPSWIVKVPLMFAQNTVNVTIGPAAFLPAEAEGGFLWAALTRLDVFGIWHIILACIALSCIGGYSAKKASAAVIPLWLIYSVIVTVFTWFGYKQLG